MTQSSSTRKPVATDVLACALRTDAGLDACVAIIRDALKITDGTVAFAEVGSAENRRRYANLANAYQRAEFIKSWFVAELDAAAERVLQNG